MTSNHTNPLVERYPTVEELRSDHSDIDIKRSLSEINTEQKLIHLTHRVNLPDILSDGLQAGELAPEERHLAWKHGPKATKGNDHIHDLTKLTEEYLDEVRDMTDWGDPDILPKRSDTIKFWPDPHVPECLLSDDSKSPKGVLRVAIAAGEDRVPYVGLVIDPKEFDDQHYMLGDHLLAAQLFHELGKKHYRGKEVAPDTLIELASEYWRLAMAVTGDLSVLFDHLDNYQIPEILIPADSSHPLNPPETIPASMIQTAVIPEWTDDPTSLNTDASRQAKAPPGEYAIVYHQP